MPDDPRDPLDARTLIEVLADEGVLYVLIGGLAVIAHGSTRVTQDVDIVPEPSAANYQRLERALLRLEAKLSGIDAHLLGIELDAATLAGGANFTMDTRAGGLDVMQEVPGMSPYAVLAARSLVADVYGHRVLIVSADDLVRMKLASGREKDFADVRALGRADSELPPM